MTTDNWNRHLFCSEQIFNNSEFVTVHTMKKITWNISTSILKLFLIITMFPNSIWNFSKRNMGLSKKHILTVLKKPLNENRGNTGPNPNNKSGFSYWEILRGCQKLSYNKVILKNQFSTFNAVDKCETYRNSKGIFRILSWMSEVPWMGTMILQICRLEVALKTQKKILFRFQTFRN